MATFVTADQHFGHHNMSAYEGRPENFNELLVDAWNSVVSPEDTVYVLGDFALASPAYAAMCLASLNGRKVLFLGNHDRSAKRMLEAGFAEVHGSRGSRRDYKENGAPYMVLEGTDYGTVLLSHYPLYPENLPTELRGLTNFHGHVHSNPYDSRPYHRNVSVDAVGYAPVLLISD